MPRTRRAPAPTVEVPMPVTEQTVTTERDGQIQLIPRERYTPRLENISTGQIDGPVLAAETEFVENVRSLGLIQPIAVTELPNGRFRLEAGRRRLYAVRTINGGDTGTIAAQVYPLGTPIRLGAAMALSENTHRRANPLTDLQAIEEMMRSGATEEQICRALRMTPAMIRARLRLAELTPVLRTEMEQGRLSPSLGERIARLDSTRQQQLLTALTLRQGQVGPERARLTGNDVREVLQVAQQEQLDALPSSMFETPAAAPAIAGLRAATITREELEAALIGEGLEAGWPLVIRLLEAAETVMPVSPDEASDIIAADLSALLDAARRMVV